MTHSFSSLAIGLAFLLGGVCILLKTFFNIEIPYFRLLAAVVFIWIGISIISGTITTYVRYNRHHSFDSQDTEDEDDAQ